MTPKQADFRSTLIAAIVAKSASGDPRQTATAGLALALPEPTSTQEASAQIDALQAGHAKAFAAYDRSWADATLAKMVAAWGNTFADAPANGNRDAIVAVVRG